MGLIHAEKKAKETEKGKPDMPTMHREQAMTTLRHEDSKRIVDHIQQKKEMALFYFTLKLKPGKSSPSALPLALGLIQEPVSGCWEVDTP